jgi:uncharacterized protein (TIGR02722 family)
MKKILSGFALAAMAVVITGCATPTTRIDTRNDRGPQVAGLDYRDLQEAASAMLQSLFRSGRLDRTDGQAYVMTVGKVKNDTPQRFDTDTLTSYITEELMNSGKVMVTSAMAASAGNVDEMVNAGRSVRGNAEVNQQTVAKTGQPVAPTHSVFGKVIERQIYMDGGDRQVEYWFQLKITEIASGLQWWQKQYVIGKRAAAENALAR